MADSTAMLPDAQAASWRAAGMPHSRSSTVAGIPPSWPWPVNSWPNALPTWITPRSAGSTPDASSVPATASAVSSAKPWPARAQLRAKSVWKPPATQVLMRHLLAFSLPEDYT